MMVILDASALLAFVQGEPGASMVEPILPGAVVGAANWSETAQKVQHRAGNWAAVNAVLDGYGVTVEPVTRIDAELAAALWQETAELSLADHLCLALADRLDGVVYTADRAWGTTGRVRQIR